MHHRLKCEIDSFVSSKRREKIAACQRVLAMRLLGIDFDEARSAGAASRSGLVRRLDRLIERERLRGSRGHWSYDLNRHIALKQLRDALA